MKDLKLNDDGDLDLSSGDAEIIDNLSQAIKVRLRWHKGEWLVNKAYGVPYFDNVLGQKYDRSYIETDIFQVFDDITGLDEVNDLDVKKDKRTLKVSFAVTGNGVKETGEVTI